MYSLIRRSKQEQKLHKSGFHAATPQVEDVNCMHAMPRVNIHSGSRVDGALARTF